MKIKRNTRGESVVVQSVHKTSRESKVVGVATPSRQPSFHLKRILVPVDFSQCATKALQYAMPFARQFGATLLITHVLQPYVPIPQMTGMDLDLAEAQIRKAAKRELKVICRGLPRGVAYRQVIRIGHSQTEIVAAAKELKADLIILSTHGRSGLAQVFIGGTAERVVRHAGCPVLVVRENEREFVKTSSTRKKAGR